MDISVIKANETNTVIGIKIGVTAPKTSIEFMNLACPFCKQWFEESLSLMSKAVSAGKIQRIIKLFDKEKPSLQPGNVMHRFVTIDNSEQAIKDIAAIYKTQAKWQTLPLDEVAAFAKEKLNLTEHDHPLYSTDIVEEAARANIKFVPTIMIGDHIFDESITKETLIDLINQ